MNHNHDHQGKDHNRQGHEHQYNHGPPAGRELARYHPLLPDYVPTISQQQYHNADDEKRGAQRLAHLSQGIVVDGRVRVGERRVKPEELCDGDADRGKG